MPIAAQACDPNPWAALLIDLDVARTHSRPHVSDNNPYSESRFKTLKYRPEQHLDDADVFLLFEQVRGKAVAQGMHRDALVKTGRASRRVHRTVQLARTHRIYRVLSGKQPPSIGHLALAPGHAVPGAQALEHHRGEHRVAILAALASLNAQYHALAVYIAHLQPDHLTGTQPRPVGHRQSGLILERAGCSDQAPHFSATQHHR